MLGWAPQTIHSEIKCGTIEQNRQKSNTATSTVINVLNKSWKWANRL